eukprot:GHUV01000934.1.p1 GENE.GHUV01000934.1~~GHUV01000934.1.p1  ORF type:complete len:392 (+),score=78.12 GHUV01000934.1:190-1365(+)
MAPPIALFGLQLYGQLAKLGVAASQAGFFISPLSAYLALILALNGAGPLSQTQKELWVLLTQKQLPANSANVSTAEAALNSQTSGLVKGLLAQSSNNGTQLVVANALWTNQTTIKQQYANSMLTLFQAPVTAVSSAVPINAWADKATKGLIKTAVPENAEFKAVITNAVYFKGAWQQPFAKANTRKMDFNLAPEKPVQVAMMYESFRNGVQFAESPGAFRAVKLPYKGSNMAAIAVLPDMYEYGYNADKALTGIGMDKILNAPWQDAETAEPSLRVYMPKFIVNLDMMPLGKAMQALGVSAAFNPNVADFSRLSDQGLYITDVLQSVVVIVDEVGTEAAAVTTILAGATAYMPEKMTDPIVLDRPFIFMIVDDSTDTVLFMGTVRDPSKAQ